MVAGKTIASPLMKARSSSRTRRLVKNSSYTQLQEATTATTVSVNSN